MTLAIADARTRYNEDGGVVRRGASARVDTDDAGLVERARRGDGGAFGALARRYGARVAGLARGLAGRHGSVDDLVQEALLRAFRALPALDDPARFAGWLMQIARRSCLDQLRRTALDQGARRFLEAEAAARPDAGAHPTSDPRRLAEDDEEGARVRAAVAALDEPSREVIELFYYAHASYDEIALALGLSRAGVNQRLTRARDRLRAAFAPPEGPTP